MSNGLTDSGRDFKFPLLLALNICSLLGIGYLLYAQYTSRQELASVKDQVDKEVMRLRDASAVTTQTQRRTISQLEDRLEEAKRDVARQAGQTRVEANRHAEEIAKQLKSEQDRLAAMQSKTSSELASAKESITTTQSRLGEVSTEVTSVKTDVANTKTDLEKTIADLKSTRGDLGVQSGLIATNSKELQALRELGERNYFEFTLGKGKEPQKVGDILVLLRKADPKRNRYTIELVADDKRVEKKDKTANEPVQFYVARARQPYELVVNSVRKDQIAGYLSTPKVQSARGGQ